MTPAELEVNARSYLDKLCLDITNRCVGSAGNRLATDFFADKMTGFGFRTESPQFSCIDWSHGDIQLTAAGEQMETFISPYSSDCHVEAPLIVASSVAELESIQAEGKILLLRGDIAKEQLMPKNFTFYNPDQHKHIVRLLELKQPSAIIAATSRNPELAGGIYPFPLIEDGDFDIPSAYMTEDVGHNLAGHAGEQVSLSFDAMRIPSTGCNVIARKGSNPAIRTVIFAHIDAKIGTPGALDNATGVITLLLLAELLKDYEGRLTIELVALNGEDYFSAPGEVQYLENNPNQLADVILGINLDAPGYNQGKTAYSMYDCPAEIASIIHRLFPIEKGFIEGEPWYQSDHSLFIMNNRPALAITSEQFMHLSTYITHTQKDHPRLVDPSILVETALSLRELLLDLDVQNT
ncbi:M28 family peptidase [Chloroflexota bacterium]